jgi:galactokinase
LAEPSHQAAFLERYGRPAAVRAAAPGRVNLIGEHTDYNNGFVLPIATPQETEVLMVPRDDRHVRLWSANVVSSDQHARYTLGTESRSGTWVDYVAGVTAALREADQTTPGFDASIRSTVPLGAGLSSSASLEVAVLRALNDVFSLRLDALAVARLAHWAETRFVGVPVGMMDQMAASLALSDSALFIDTRSLTYQRLPLPADTGLIVIDSGVTHRHAGGEYRTRRRECDEAARCLGLASLRDATLQTLESTAVPEPLRRRARHVITENDRVLQARRALQDGDPTDFGMLMNASHASLRDDFEVSVPDVDRLVALAQSEPGVFGARLTGGGFGGSIVALANQALAGPAARRIAAAYSAGGPVAGAVLIP